MLFKSKIAAANFQKQVSTASPLIKNAVTAGLWISKSKILSRIPILKTLVKLTLSLVRMHNKAFEIGYDSTDSKNELRECGFPSSVASKFEHLDLLIIGSGPGGAVAAATAIKNNLNYLLVEKGRESNKQIRTHSAEQLTKHFRFGGQEVILSWPPIPYAQGEVWGGGSEINSGLFHFLPAEVKNSWSTITGISVEDLANAEESVSKSLQIEPQTNDCMGIYRHSPILRMKDVLSWQGHTVPRWRHYSSAHKYEHFGMSQTYLKDVPEQNRVLDHDVEKLKINDDFVEISLKGFDCAHNIKAAKVCLSAGTIASPEILSRSGLAKRKDFGIQCHIMIREFAEFEREVNDLIDIDPHQIWSHDHQFKIGAAVGTPELLAASVGSYGINSTEQLKKIASYYISIPSFGRNGFIKLGKNLVPYLIPSKKLTRQLKMAQEILQNAIEAAGGKLIGDGSLNISTVHIFGSIPLGLSSVIDNQGYVKNTNRRVYIRDGSLIPTHPLVNPQGPLMFLISSLSS